MSSEITATADDARSIVHFFLSHNHRDKEVARRLDAQLNLVGAEAGRVQRLTGRYTLG